MHIGRYEKQCEGTSRLESIELWKKLAKYLNCFRGERGKTSFGFSSSVTEMSQPQPDLTRMDAVGLCRLAVIEGLHTI